MKIVWIQGSPGTGKTYKLRELLKAEFDNGTEPIDVAYVSFTQKGAYQGIEIAKSAFELADEECEYMRTLHSLAFRMLSLKREGVYDKKEALPFLTGAFSKIESTLIKKILNEMDIFDSEETLSLSDFMKEMKAKYDMSPPIVEAITDAYKYYKDKQKKLSFSEMLRACIEQKITAPCKVIFVDEWQDLTPLQKTFLLSVFPEAHTWYLAGDLDQSIYAWAGADGKFLFDESMVTEKIYLNATFRCPKNVWRYAKVVHDQLYVREKIEAVTVAGADKGRVYFDSDYPVNMTTFKAMLSRAVESGSRVLSLSTVKNHFLVQAGILDSLCIPYALKTGRYTSAVVNFDKDIYKIIMKGLTVVLNRDFYRHYVLGQNVEGFVPRANLLDDVSGERLKYFEKKEIDELLSGEYVAFEDVKKMSELLWTYIQKHWTKLEPCDRIKIKRLLALSLTFPKRFNYWNGIVQFQTVFSAKGSEEEFVCLDVSLSAKRWKQVIEDKDEHDRYVREMYVGITRAKKELYIYSAKEDLERNTVFNVGGIA